MKVVHVIKCAVTFVNESYRQYTKKKKKERGQSYYIVAQAIA